jgi:type III restriction enzyme
MELKPYQQQVINDLTDYLDYIQTWRRVDLAFEKFWNARGFKVGGDDGLPTYKNNIPECPHVCIKVPTGGGKTFIACNALRPILEAMPEGKTKAVVWLVPSNTILEQTVRNLKNPRHPYREKIDSHFNGRVSIYEKEELLQGAGFNPATVREQLSILVLSYDSIRSNKKDGRKIYQSNGNLDNFVPTYQNPDTLLPEIDESALIQVINQMNPVCIVDESHNAESDLSVEMLRNINPCFILDLTATPRNNSNIISYVSPMELKRENMVKLPVIVYNHHNNNDVMRDALDLQRKLEARANACMEKGGEYIRPIVLFQAQPKTNQDNATFEKIKQTLIDLGIGPHRIAIKTAAINELKSWDDLLAPDCPIRYIITVNALKEGWDCPFAYILASLANKASTVDVEQILGRILRQPYAKKSQDRFLNMSYVFTASAMFQDTLENIVKALNKAGFSKMDYRVAETSPAELERKPDKPVQTNLPVTEDDGDELQLDPSSIGFDPNQENVLGEEKTAAQPLTEMEKSALAIGEEYETKAKEQNTDNKFPPEWGAAMRKSEIREIYREEASTIKWPEFYIELPNNLGLNWELFSDNETEQPLSKGSLLKGFFLAKADININFAASGSPIYVVDATDEFVPKYEKAAPQIRESLLKYLSSQPEEVQIKQLTELIFNNIRKIDALADRDIKDYIKRVIGSFNNDQIGELKENPYRYSEIIKKKIVDLMDEYAEAEFYRRLDTDQIFIRESKGFLDAINLTDEPVLGIKNSLYSEEERGNNFELKVINEVANLENILFWHRNIERKGFVINGGFINHYPDYIVYTKRHKLVVIETKGDDRDNSDSRTKLKLGHAWANKAGNDRFKYFMVFDKNPLEGAYSLDEFLGVMKEL